MMNRIFGSLRHYIHPTTFNRLVARRLLIHPATPRHFSQRLLRPSHFRPNHSIFRHHVHTRSRLVTVRSLIVRPSHRLLRLLLTRLKSQYQLGTTKRLLSVNSSIMRVHHRYNHFHPSRKRMSRQIVIIFLNRVALLRLLYLYTIYPVRRLIHDNTTHLNGHIPVNRHNISPLGRCINRIVRYK